MAYGIHDLELTGLEVKTILSVSVRHEKGEHGRLELVADLGDIQMDKPVHEAASMQKVALSGVKGGSKKVIFSGIITGLTVKSMGKSCHVKLTALSHSYVMDIRKRSRSFQDTSMTYGALVQKIVGEYSGGESQILFADRPMGEIAVQYQETDWQFLKRILSILHVPLVSSECREQLCVYAGVAQIPGTPEPILTEAIRKDSDDMAYWQETGEEVVDTDFIIYRVKLDNTVPLYTEASFRGKFLIAESVEYETIGSTVYEFITLRSKPGILQRTIYPQHLVGSALEGKIIQVKGEKVQVHLKIDDDEQSNDCYWFPFSTPSASPDGSGWYCMPEKGDQVRVYFPAKKTKEVMAISAVSTYQDPTGSNGAPADSDGSGSGGSSGSGSGSGSSGSSGGGSSSGGSSGIGVSVGIGSGAAAGIAGGAGAVPGPAADPDAGKDKMSDPATKYLRTIDGQEVKLSPSGIVVLCSGGTVKVEVLKNGKINLYAQDTIEINAELKTSLQAKRSTNMKVEKKADFKSGKGGSMALDEKGNITMKGTEVHMN